MATSGLLARAARDDYPAWLAQATAAGGCSRPVRLRGQVHHLNPATGEILYTVSTADAPDGVIYTACGDRRTSVCPACAETYRADTYQLIRAGLAGGKGIPASVAAHPCVFATFTAPSFGAGHARITSPGGRVLRCRPRRKHTICPHGRSLSCPRRHLDTDACLGRPLCPDCYDYHAAVVWNAHAPELWRRTTIALRRRLDRLARDHGTRVKLSYAKVAEFQRRGLVHFHAIIRLDGLDPADPYRIIAPPPAFTAQLLTATIRAVVTRNVATLVDAPSVSQIEIEPLTLDEARRIIELAARRRNGTRWSVALALGLRQGEALGLRWQLQRLAWQTRVRRPACLRQRPSPAQLLPRLHRPRPRLSATDGGRAQIHRTQIGQERPHDRALAAAGGGAQGSPGGPA